MALLENISLIKRRCHKARWCYHHHLGLLQLKTATAEYFSEALAHQFCLYKVLVRGIYDSPSSCS